MGSFLLVIFVLTCHCVFMLPNQCGLDSVTERTGCGLGLCFFSNVNFTVLVLPFLSWGCFCFISRLLLSDHCSRGFWHGKG